MRNPIYKIYKGMPYAYRWRKKARGDLDQLMSDGREAWEPAPTADWVSPPAEVAPSLVSVDDWTLANAWRVANQSNSAVDHPLPETFLLAGGLVRCGICGRPLLGRGRTAHRPIYRCAGRRDDQRPCGCARSVAAVLDERVWTRVLRTAAEGRPPLGRQPGTAGKLVWFHEGSAAGLPESPFLGSIDVEALLGQVKQDHAATWEPGSLHDLVDRVRHVTDERTQSDRERLAALNAAWADLIHYYTNDRASLVNAPFAIRRQWLEQLGIVVRVWPRGYGHLLKVMSSVDPDRVPRQDLPALSATETSRAKKHQLIAADGDASTG